MSQKHSYLAIEIYHDNGEGTRWVGSSETPGIDRDGVTDDDEAVWIAYVNYLNLARGYRYRLVRFTVTTAREIIHV